MLCQDDGKPLTEKLIENTVRRAARRVNLRNNGPHILRHTFCSHLAMRGASARAKLGSAGGGNRTLTGGKPHRILSPARLPVSPLRRITYQDRSVSSHRIAGISLA